MSVNSLKQERLNDSVPCIEMNDGTQDLDRSNPPSSRTKQSKKIPVNKNATPVTEHPVPKLSLADKLLLFGGEEGLLSYYVGLREAAESARRDGSECFCDPRDAVMRQRIEHEGWRPKVVFKEVDDGGGGDGKDAGSSEFGFSSKQTALDEDSAEKDDVLYGTLDEEHKKKSFVCGVQGCNAELNSLASYESHYHTSHNFVCHVCRRTFVSNFLLDVHLEENHDSYFQVLSPRIDMYRCLVECCSLKFRTPDVRKDHLVTAHKFPASFSFHRPIKDKTPQKKKSSKKRGGGGGLNNNNSSSNHNHNHNSNNIVMDSPDSAATMSSSEIEPPSRSLASLSTGAANSASNAEMDVDLREVVMEEGEGRGAGDVVMEEGKGRGQQQNRGRGRRGKNASPRVPTTICFGRGSQRAFQHRGGRGRGTRGRHWHQRQDSEMDTTVNIEKVDFGDLADSLAECG